MKNCPKECIVKVFLFIQKKRKNRELLATLVIFSIFLLKWNYGKLGPFSIFSFFEQNEKNEKMVRINIIFSFYCFSIFGEKRKNRKMSQELDIISFFSFSNNSKHFGQSNFPFFQQKRKKEILLILIIFAYFKVQ